MSKQREFNIGDVVLLTEEGLPSVKNVTSHCTAKIVDRSSWGSWEFRMLNGPREGFTYYGQDDRILCLSIDKDKTMIKPTLLVRSTSRPYMAVLRHLKKVKTISVREGMDDYGLSGGHLTKIISNMRKDGHRVWKAMRVHPVTGRRYARYFYDEPQVAKAA